MEIYQNFKKYTKDIINGYVYLGKYHNFQIYL